MPLNVVPIKYGYYIPSWIPTIWTFVVSMAEVNLAVVAKAYNYLALSVAGTITTDQSTPPPSMGNSLPM